MINLKQFTTGDRFLMLAIDHRGSFKKVVDPVNPDAVEPQAVTDLKALIIESLEDMFSGLLIDPEYGLAAYKKKSKPFLLSIEKTGYTDKEGERITELEYSVEELKQKGASGIKLLLYFNPDLPSAAVQLKTARQVLEDCHTHDLPLFLEIVTYKETNTAEMIIRSVQTFMEQNIKADVFKLQYPGNVESAKLITKILGTTPWILLTRGEDFDTFKRHLQEAVGAGAKGFLAGRSVWQEVADHTGEDRKKFLQTTARQRFKEICDIVV